MTDPITPPVPQAVIDDINKVAVPVTNAVEAEVTKVKTFASTPVVAAAIHVAITLGTAYGLKLNAGDVATISALWAGGSAYFVSVITALKAAGIK